MYRNNYDRQLIYSFIDYIEWNNDRILEIYLILTYQTMIK